MHAYAVIMAGGSGTRLWPMSRSDRPKQLLPLLDGESLLVSTVERLAGVFDPDHIYIIGAADHAEQVMSSLKRLPPKNYIPEPCPRDTANAIGLAASVLHRLHGSCRMGVFTADHLIEPNEQFHEAIRTALEQVDSRPDHLCTFGIRPTWPHTGLGYIQREHQVSEGVYEVRSFREKPDRWTAEQYLASGQYFWNSGMFVWQTDTILDHIRTNLPDNGARLAELADSYGSDDWLARAQQVYPMLDKISIDYAVMEKASKVLVIEMACKWVDVGTWAELGALTGVDDNNNAVTDQQAILLDCHNSVVVNESNHLIAGIGLRDMVIVQTKDVTLICPREEAQRVKEMVELVRTRAGDHYV